MATEPLYSMLLRPGSLSVLFQPIVAAQDGLAVRFVEALTRGPRGTNLEAADVLFEYARRKGKAAELDRVCTRQALAAAAALPAGIGVSLNVHASTLDQDGDFAPFLAGLAAENRRPAADVVVEIVEHAPRWAGPKFYQALAALRREGMRVALDDIGSGNSTYRMMLDCNPEYFKIDRYLVNGCYADARRRAVLQSLCGLARTFGALVVAEGVETGEDLATVCSLGFDFAQGFLLAEPQPIGEIARRLRDDAPRLREE